MNLSQSSQKQLRTPAVLLIAWRRPDTIEAVINSLRVANPERVYVACDGPNPARAGEAEMVKLTRSVVEKAIDWPCKVEELYSEINLGCRLGVSTAINWFFDQEEEGIILEDDIVVHEDFFNYCANLLNHYRNDTRVWAISADNFQDGQWRGSGSYYFSHNPHCWGWASWRRAWRHYDLNLTTWPEFRDSGAMVHLFSNTAERQFWWNIWERLYRDGQPDTWDYQWSYTVMVNGGLVALPNTNLASNIGFNKQATHTLSHVSTLANLPTQPLGEIVHPRHVLRNTDADDYFVFKHVQTPSSPMHSAKPLPDLTTVRPRIRVLLENGERLSVDIGCGGMPRNPFNAEKLIGFDIYISQEGVFPCVIGFEPFPLADNSVDFVSAFDFIGHLPRNAIINGNITSPFIDAMSEIWRILKPGGLFYAQTPAYPSNAAFANPSQVNVITEGSISYFAKRFGLDGEAVDDWGLEQGRQNGFQGEFLLLNQWWSGTDLCWKLRCEKKVLESI